MAKMKSASGSELINHYNAVRVRVIGDCELDLKYVGLPDDDGNADEQELVSLTVETTTKRPLTQLANFVQQRACLEVSVDGFGEYFDIKSIIAFHAPVATGYPQ